MIQYHVFVGTIAEIEAEFNKWVASLATGTNINSGPLTPIGDGRFFKEIVYVLPVRANGIAIPEVRHGVN